MIKAKVYAGIGKKDGATKVINDSLRVLENDQEWLDEFFQALKEDVTDSSLEEKERSVLEPFYFKETLGIARQVEPSSFLR